MGEPVRTHQDLQYDADETAKGAISTAALAPGPKKKNQKKKHPGLFSKHDRSWGGIAATKTGEQSPVWFYCSSKCNCKDYV
jgi:hypothetical protein